jgi:hypothetical protein
MRIDGTRYTTKFLAMIRGVHRNFGAYGAGLVLAHGKVPASHALCLLNLR